MRIINTDGLRLLIADEGKELYEKESEQNMGAYLFMAIEAEASDFEERDIIQEEISEGTEDE